MEYMPEKLSVLPESPNYLYDIDGFFVGYITARKGGMSTDGLIAAEIARRWNACAGIDTAHLWPGAMGEVVEALKSHACVCSHQCLAFPGDGNKCPHDKTRAILAKLGKTP